MDLAQLKSYVAAHVASAEDSVKAEFERFVSFVEGEDAKVKAEVEHLSGLGYTVTPPGGNS